MTRTCGECTLCCKLMGVEEIPKPPNVWCEHCDKGTGCRIYHGKPESCSAFECSWLATPDLPDDLRPDRTHCLLAANLNDDGSLSSISCFVDPDYPDAWQKAPMNDLMRVIVVSMDTPIVITSGPSLKKRVMFKLGKRLVGVKEVSMTPPDATGKQIIVGDMTDAD